MKRKVLSVMLCAAMVVSMTACGGSDAKENTAFQQMHLFLKQNRVKQPSRMHRRKNRSPVH